MLKFLFIHLLILSLISDSLQHNSVPSPSWLETILLSEMWHFGYLMEGIAPLLKDGVENIPHPMHHTSYEIPLDLSPGYYKQ